MRLKITGICIALVLLLAVTSFAQGWQYGYQREYDIDFWAVDFANATVGYAVGSGGSIFKTTDGGDTWTQQTSGTTMALYSVFAIDNSVAWIVGDTGTILSTTDGGANWVTHPQSGVLTTTDLMTIQFIGTNGWIGGKGGQIYLSTDSGVNWGAATTIAHTDDVNGIAMASSTIGYAASDGDGIMYTTDGGVTWSAASVNFGMYPYTRTDVEAIMVIDDTTGVATGWGSLVGPQPTILLMTYDAGQTWNVAEPTYGWNTYGYGYGLAMFGDGEVVVTGGGSGSAGFILHSGTDYTDWSTTPAFSGEDVRAACVVPGTNRIVAVGDEGVIALSTDKGVTWSFAFDPGPGFAGWYGFAYLNTTSIYACGAAASVVKLELDDLGVPTGDYTWMAVAPQDFAPARLEDIACVDGVIYISGSNQYLCKSTDEGATWTQLNHTTSATDYIYKMYWKDADNGILVGEIGSRETIWTTSNGGTTLNIVWYDSTGASNQWNSISFAPEDGNVGVIVGDNNLQLYTTDGGGTWEWGVSDWTSTTGDCNEAHMVSASEGWAACDGGVVLKTTDGGKNWFIQPSFTTKLLADVDFRYPDQQGYGWIVGDDQEFWYTTDGGANWTADNPTLASSTHDITSVYFQREVGKLWIGCDEGQALWRGNDDVTAADDPVALPYFLGQNYPNPFGPATTIEFTLPNDDNVELNVYDVKGRLVARVLNKPMEAGIHTVNFDAKGLQAGVYFYKLKTNTGVMTRKMVLLK